MINQQQRESNVLENAEEQLIQAEEQYSELTDDEEGTSSGAFVIIAAVVVSGIIAAFLFMRYMINQSKIKLVEQARERHEKIKNLNNDGSELTQVAVKMKKGTDNTRGDSNGHGKVMNNTCIQSGDNLDEYEEQYNANDDFAIFQVGDNAVGGLMNLQQKQN